MLATVTYNDAESDRIHIASVMTNRSMTISEALEAAGVDMEEYADLQGWEGYDYNALDIYYM